MKIFDCCMNVIRQLMFIYTIKIKSNDQYKNFEKIKEYKNETNYSFMMKEPSFDEKKTKINEFISFPMFLFHYFQLNHRKSSFQVI